ncbi:MAG: hypothetical protein ACTSYC_02775 [Promethearchaeota archaeon]
MGFYYEQLLIKKQFFYEKQLMNYYDFRIISINEKYFKDPKRETVLVDYVRTAISKKGETIVRNRGEHPK